MNVFHIRYTCSGELQQEIVEFITRNAAKYIIAQEFASREHIQCYVETSVVKKTWVNKFNAKFHGLDRRDKYVEPDKGKTLLYVCKGADLATQPVILAKRGFTDEEVTNLHKEYWKHQIPIEIQNICDTPPLTKEEKVKKSKPLPFMKQVRLKLDTEYPDKDWSMSDRTLVFKNVMYLLGDQCKALDRNIITRMTYGVLNSLVKSKQEWYYHWYIECFNETPDYTHLDCPALKGPVVDLYEPEEEHNSSTEYMKYYEIK